MAAINSCLTCATPVLGGRMEPRVCSTSCCNAAMFELVRIQATLDVAPPALEDDVPASREAMLHRLSEVGLRQRRSLLLRAVGAWDKTIRSAFPAPTPTEAASVRAAQFVG